ncbi:adhesion G protein-coupled receptor F5-like [Nothobranchius furzeri]|uniref:Adhesion G protein-coupled receptor F5-like n=1 Tax=Nothobranchius furzeri TaxID=105023 RepID=A0A9D2Z2Z1_NOTFU|nr:adhesion G protein-coupled receptor F5-like [Nothobranchius furzeri]
MDNSRNIVTIFVLVVTLLLLETGKMGDCASPNELVHHKVDWLSHMRGKRNVFSAEEISTVDILLNASNVESLEQIQSTLHATSFPVHLDDTEILNITITTVCLSADDGIQCKCEGQYAWPHSTCIAYGACDSLSSGICKCIRGIPTDNSTCQPVSELHVQTEYEVELQLNLTDITTLNFLKAFLNSAGLYLSVSPTVNVTQIDLTTVCSPFNGNYQCRCEDQYHWTYDQCRMYGSCDSITYDTCGCINAIPPDGQFCRSVADDISLMILDCWGGPMTRHRILLLLIGVPACRPWTSVDSGMAAGILRSLEPDLPAALSCTGSR